MLAPVDRLILRTFPGFRSRLAALAGSAVWAPGPQKLHSEANSDKQEPDARR